MQAELSDKINEKQGLRSVARTALVVVLVCLIMPFLQISAGETVQSFSILDFAGTAFRYSDIGFLLPLNASSMLIVSRICGWMLALLSAVAFIMTFNRSKTTKTKDNSLWIMIFSIVGLGLCFGLYFYIQYLLLNYAEGNITVGFDNGGLAMIAAFVVAVLALLVKQVNNRTKLAAILIFLCIPLTVIFGSVLLDNRKYFFISLLVIFETMLPFFLIFENRKPEARELVVIAVVAAIGVVGRAIFFMLPNCKPVTAIVIIAGACLGPEAGFLTGAMTAFVSNFFFGQGPWTPWQMFSFGIIGFLTGLLFRKGILKKDRIKTLAVYGVAVTILIFGFLMNTYTVLTMDFVSSLPEVLAIYVSGFPVDCVHAASTAIFLLVLAKPMIDKLDRVRVKYGMMEAEHPKGEKDG